MGKDTSEERKTTWEKKERKKERKKEGMKERTTWENMRVERIKRKKERKKDLHGKRYE